MLVKGGTGHNQGGHWRCDCVTDLVFQEKSYKTNLHLFSAYAGVVWRSVNKNNRSRESIFLREGHIWWFLYPLCKHSRRWWFQTSLRSLWRHCNENNTYCMNWQNTSPISPTRTSLESIFITMTSQWARLCLKSPDARLFVQAFI